MSEANKHIIYSVADIKRYLGGSMTPAEMHAIEMAALDDPFLAEAMEGYELMEEKDWSKELAVLKQQLNKEENTKVIPISQAPAFKWWRAVAAVLIIGIGVGTSYILTNKQSKERVPVAKIRTATDSAIASNVTPAAVDSAAPASAGTFTVTTGQFATVQQQPAGAITLPVPGGQNYSATADEKAIKDSSFIYRPAPAAPADLAMKDRGNIGTVDDGESSKTTINMETVTATKQSPAYNTQTNEGYIDNNLNFNKAEIDKFKSQANGNTNNQQNILRFYNGLVVTPDNKPVVYASVNVPENKKPVYTDANGRFDFASTDTAVKVTITSAGYGTQKLTLNNYNYKAGVAQPGKIVLQPVAVETEKIAMAKRREVVKKQMPVADSTDEDDEEDDAAPSGGWVEYNNYLNNNLVMPNEAKTNNIHGEVEVFVKLNNKGDIRQVKVAKPLCNQCDAEALRLVKEGPKFELKKNKTRNVKVKVKF